MAKKVFSNEDTQILLTQSESKSAEDWVVYFNNKYTKKQIWDKCFHMGIKCGKLSKERKSEVQSSNSRRYNINQDYFKHWSENMAYILGLWYADGCIYREMSFDITLHKRDKYLLKLIKDELGYEGSLYDYVDRQAARINFSCVTIYNDLVALGGSKRKSLSITFPNIPKQYLSDFIRGYFDGDGCVMNLKGNRLQTAFTCGSKIFLEELLHLLREEADVEGGFFDDSCMSLKFGKKDSIKIGQYIYKHNSKFFLKRKKDKFINFI